MRITMAITVTLVSGPRRSGKSTVIRQMIEQCYVGAPHYVRLTRADGDKQKPVCVTVPAEDCGVVSACWVQYDAGKIFELLPEKLAAIHRRDRSSDIIIEADADPSLRYAYPYNARLFVMAAPSSVSELFRTDARAAEALRAALDDTTTFAAEMFGLCGESAVPEDDSHEDRPKLTASQMRRFLRSPLGRDLASRSQLHPAYHGLIESDVILMNTAIGGATPAVDEAKHRIEAITDCLRSGSARRGCVFCCDPQDPRDPLRNRFFDALRRVCTSRQ
ncbi:MAG: hypothetical protein JSV19_02000 [Phycisphaerales bacterium]|nr:MAG: hypothetical protein JSV19_02000 [Phycisphaerales bacterium]